MLTFLYIESSTIFNVMAIRWSLVMTEFV